MECFFLYIARQTTSDRIWQIEKRSHNLLTNIINGCLPINLMLKKRFIIFMEPFSSSYEWHKAVAFYCFNNQG